MPEVRRVFLGDCRRAGPVGDRFACAVADDGPGFPAHLLGRLGEPYLSTRAGASNHMGLGIFIAQSLLERTGARVSFARRKEEMDESDAGLIRFPMRARHGPPFEHNAFRSHVPAPPSI